MTPTGRREERTTLRPQMSPDETKLLYPSRRYSGLLSVLMGLNTSGEMNDELGISSKVAFWSLDSKWIGGLHTDDFTPEIFIMSLEEGVRRDLNAGRRRPRTLQWWAPSPPVKVDTRGIVRAALGEGTVFSPPLEIPAQEIIP